MRLFVAIDMPENVKESLITLRDNTIPSARWTSPHQMHLTLRFIGEVDEKIAMVYRSALEKINVPSFSMALKGVGHFPPGNRKPPRVLWAGVDAPPGLFELQRQVSAQLESVGLDKDDYDHYSAHITLARLKLRKRDASVSGFLAQHENFSTPAFSVTEFVLYESQLSPQGARYAKLQAYPLEA